MLAIMALSNATLKFNIKYYAVAFIIAKTDATNLTKIIDNVERSSKTHVSRKTCEIWRDKSCSQPWFCGSAATETADDQNGF